MSRATRLHDHRIGVDGPSPIAALLGALGARGRALLGWAVTSTEGLSWPSSGGFVRSRGGDVEWLFVDPLGRAAPHHGVGTEQEALAVARRVSGWLGTKAEELTDERCLALSHASGLRLELVDGQIFAMGIATMPHNLMQSSLTELLTLRKRRGCRVLGESTMVHIDDANFVNPDLTLVCGDLSSPDEHPDRLANPVLVVEIWSKSNKKDERDRKRRQYHGLDTLKHYLELDSRRRRGTLWTREDDGTWTGSSLDEIVELKHVGIRLTMSEVYDGTGIRR